MTYPYNDKAMNYDLEKHRYILNQDYVTNTLGEDLMELDDMNDTKRSTLALRFLDRSSRILYNFIYSYAQNFVKDYVEYLLAKKPEYRQPILEALEEQLFYMLRNGDLSTYSGINLFKQTKIELKRTDSISPQAKDILQNAGILYTGYYEVPLNFNNVKRSDY